jgi:hypothetical protein
MAKCKVPTLTIPLVHLEPVWKDASRPEYYVLVPECPHRCPFLNTADGHRCCLGWQDRKGMKPGPKCVPGKYRLVKA